MRIGIDVRHLAKGPFTGIHAVTCALVEAIAANAPDDTIRIFYNGHRQPPRVLRSWEKRFENVSVRVERLPNRLFDLSARVVRQPKVDRLLGGVDVFLSPHALLLPLERAPRVIVLHDLSFVVHPEFFSPKGRLWHQFMGFRQQVRRAKAIVVPSEATARDITRLWGIARKKITVVSWAAPSVHGARSMKHETENMKPGARDSGSMVQDSGKEKRRRTILFVGTVEARKNVLGLIRAFKALREEPQCADTLLVVVGAYGWGSREVLQEAARLLPKDAVRFRGYVPEGEKAMLYRSADLFAYPSFYEGSSLQALEAMSAGVPVVTSRTTSLPEVVGDAALLVDPARPDEIAEAMRAVLTDPNLAAELSRRGRKRAAQFTWEKTAERVLTLLRQVASASNETP